jgi:hypothetical protein
MRLAHTVLGTAFVLLAGIAPGWGGELNGFTFEMLYENRNALSLKFFGRPSINNSGTVAFHDRSAGGGMIVVDRNGARLVASTKEFSFGNSAVINDSGDVVFRVSNPIPMCSNCDAIGNGIVVTDGRRRQVILRDGSPQIGDPVINNRGTVVYGAGPNHLVIADKRNSTALGPFNFVEVTGPRISISDSDRLVFVASQLPGLRSAFLYDGRRLSEVITFDASRFSINSVDVSNAGRMAMCVSDANGASTLYSFGQGHLEQLATALPYCFAVGLNGSGEIVVMLDSQLYLYKEGRLHLVLGRGSRLFGRTVSRVEISEAGSSINEAGQIAMSVLFSDGIAVVRAVPH